MRTADFDIAHVTEDIVYLVDLNQGGVSIANDAQEVVAEMMQRFHSPRRIVYRDTLNEWGELVHDGERFTGFQPFDDPIPGEVGKDETGQHFMRTLGPGIYDIPDTRYHADPCRNLSLSAGAGWTLLDKTPLHVWTGSRRLNPWFEEKNTDAFDLGKMTHAVMTQKGAGVFVVEANDWRTKHAKEQRDEARALNKIPMLAKDWERVETMVDVCMMQMSYFGIGNPFEDPSRNEITAIWETPGEYGPVTNRLMVDTHDPSRRIAYDLKTANDTDPDEWLRTSMDHGVALRAAHYIEGLNAAYPGETPWVYRFILIEKQAPHTMSLVELPATTLMLGQMQLERAREMWGWCAHKGVWPGRPRGISMPEHKPWHEAQFIERRDRDADHRRRTGDDILKLWFQFQDPRHQMEAAE